MNDYPDLKRTSQAFSKYSYPLFLASALSLLALTFFSLYWFQKQKNSSEWITHTHEVKFKIEKSYGLLSEIESAQRAYLLTKNPYYRSESKTSEEMLDTNLVGLRFMVSDNTTQLSNVEQLNELVRARIQRLHLVADSAAHLETHISSVNIGPGQLLMESIRSKIATMDQTEDDLLRLRISNKNKIDTNVSLFIVLFAAISLTILFASFLRIKNENFRRMKAEVDVDLLEATVRDRTAEINKINQELVQKNDKLESKNQDLASFTYIASHDLKEPLRKIEMFTRRIIQEYPEKLGEKTTEYHQKILEQAIRMQNLMNAILQYAQTDDDSLEYRLTDLNDIAQLAMESLSEPIQEKNAVITIGQLPTISCFPEQIEQVFINLIGNAIKYSKPGQVPAIEIKAEPLGEKSPDESGFPRGWKIDFCDNGIGFEDKYQNKIFEIFQRLHDKNSYSGTGIGLAICKKIVENHGGRIEVKSIPGEGSVFSIILPAISN
jgi:signal transduction histidine kinase